jgi:hypothetical protein
LKDRERSVSSTATTIAVFEHRPRWAPELERRFDDDRTVTVRACRRTRDLAALLADGERGVVVLDVSADPAACLDHLGRRPLAAIPTVVILTRGTRDLEWSLRELGATAVLDEFAPGHVLADACRRTWGGRM